jgi:hypothetical protein
MIKEGELFYTVWGYDQTNYEFIIVEKINSSGKTVICRRAKEELVGNTEQSNIQKPKPEGFGDKFRMKIEDEETLRGSYPFCSDASMANKRLATFWKVKEGETFYETNPIYGH